MPTESTLTITITHTFLIKCGFFAIPLCCFLFSLISIWRTHALVVDTSQKIAELKISLLSAPGAYPPDQDASSQEQPTASPTPLSLYVTKSLYGTRQRKSETKLFSTTINTPLKITFQELFGQEILASMPDFTVDPPYNGILSVDEDFQKIKYVPNKWYRGFDSFEYRVRWTDKDGTVQKLEAGAKIRIRAGVVMNRAVLPPPNVYVFSETGQTQTEAIKEYFHLLANNPVIPEHDTWLDRRYKTCAVVGNGGSLIGRKRGAEIDSHEVVVRINMSPLKGYEEDIGSKMNISIANGHSSQWCWKRNETGQSANRTYEILGQSTFKQHWSMLAGCPKLHPQIQFLPMSYLFVDLVDQILDEYHKATFHNTDKKYRSTGMMAVTAMSMICDHVSVYGFERGSKMENTYYEGGEKREWTGHSYQAEKEYFKDLAKGTGLFEPFLEIYDLYTSFSFIVD